MPGLLPLPVGATLSTTASGLQFYDFIVGSGGNPGTSDTVTIDYVAYLPNGQIFDSNNNISFPVSDVIQGFAEGVMGIEPGGTRRIVIPPNPAGHRQVRHELREIQYKPDAQASERFLS